MKSNVYYSVRLYNLEKGREAYETMSRFLIARDAFRFFLSAMTFADKGFSLSQHYFGRPALCCVKLCRVTVSAVSNNSVERVTVLDISDSYVH